MGSSFGGEARALSLTDIVTEARNVRGVGEGLVMSKMGTVLAVSYGCYGALALLEKGLELWLYQK